MNHEEIKWKDLSWKIKVGIVGGWIALVVYSLAFLYGFFSA